MTTRTYSVPGISCGHCKAAIEGDLDGADGVGVDVDIDTKTVAVHGEIGEDTVRAAVDEAGYGVTSVSSPAQRVQVARRPRTSTARSRTAGRSVSLRIDASWLPRRWLPRSASSWRARKSQ